MERLLEYFVPENYRLALDINKHTETLRGTVTITGLAQRRELKFHAVGLTIDAVTLADTPLKYTHRAGVLAMRLPANAPHMQKLANAANRGATADAGLMQNLAITIQYHAKLNRNMQGAYLSTYQYEGREERIVTTQFESHYAR